MRLALLACCLAAPALALVEVAGETGGAEVSGSARTFGLFIHDDAFDGAVVVDRLRLSAKGYWGEALAAEVAGDGIALIGPNTGGASGLASRLTLGGPGALRAVDLRRTTTNGNYQLSADFDRAFISLTLERFELHLGRQAIAHGSARLFPVSDLFAPFAGFALDTEYKPGVDGARLTVPLGERAEAEVYSVVHEDGVSSGVHLGRARMSFDGLDVSVLAGTADAVPVVALDLQGDLGGLGWYAEGLSRLDGDASPHPRATAGGTYHFLSELTVFAEVHHNGDPKDHPEALLPERWYAGAGAQYPLTPLLRLGLSVLYGIDETDALVSPTLSWDAGQEVAVDLGALVPVAEHDDPFGAAADVYYGSVRLYF
jgi:hypothetical protein